MTISDSCFLKELHPLTADLRAVNPWLGLSRFISLGCLLGSLILLAWSIDHTLLFVATTVIAGIVYAFWLICTHDAVHQTLTGWRWFDTLMPRLISYPMLWFYGLYAELHRLHHGWNGIDLRDPERIQWTLQEYQQANVVGRWYVQHQWAIDLFVLGGIGLILKTLLHGLRFRTLAPRLKWQLWIDVVGMFLIQGTFLMLAIRQGQLLRYLLFWFVLERVIGIIMQTRDHLEHYGLWGKATNYQTTQLYACRNLKTSRIVGWLMGGLDYHAVHHALPDIPFNHLPVAFDRIQTLLHQHNLPGMNQEGGYVQETIRLSQTPTVIGEPNLEDMRRRDRMVLISSL